MTLLTIFLLGTLSLAEDLKIKSDSVELLDDGTVSFYQPFVNTNEGRKYLSSESSHLPTICNLLNFETTSFTSPGKRLKRSYLIGVGLQKSFRNVQKAETQIEFLMCQSFQGSRVPRVSTRGKITFIMTPKGERYRIDQPEFGMIQGKSYPFSESNNFGGVCQLYGFENTELDQIRVQKTESKYLVTLDQRGAFRRFAKPHRNERQIDSIVCMGKKKPSITFRFDLEQLHLSLSELSLGLKKQEAQFLTDIAYELKKNHKNPEHQIFRKLSVDEITPSTRQAMYTLFFLSPFFKGIQSPWYQKSVKPILDERMIEIKNLIGLSELTQYNCNDPEMDEAVLRILVFAINAYQDRSDLLQQKDELLEFKNLSEQLLIQGLNRRNQESIQAWIRVLYQLKPKFLFDYSRSDLRPLAKQILILSEAQLRCYQ